MTDILKEYRVEINKTGQGHYIIADGCVEAIKEAYEGYDIGRGIKDEDVTDVHCQFWRNISGFHPPQTFTTGPADIPR